MGKLGLASALALFLTLGLAACDSATPTPTLRPGETPQPTPTPTLAPGETPQPTAPPSPTPSAERPPLATQEVEFRLSAPDSGDANPIRLLIMFAGDFQTFDEIEMTKVADAWVARADLPTGGLVHYVYDHYANGEPFDHYKGKREAHGDVTEILTRLLLVDPLRTTVEDVVETWNDTRVSNPTGTLTGTVIDAATGDPVIDADVTAGGIHIATDFAGRFEFPAIAAGTQRVTIHTTLGDYQPADVTTTVPPEGATDLEIAVHAAPAVDVTFDVTLPEDTPADATVWIAGNVFQLGAFSIHQNLPRIVQDISLPPLERVSPTRARGTFRLHEGTYLNYYYTIAGTWHGHEHDEQGRFAYHDAIVDSNEPTVSDQVVAWKPDHLNLVELRITTPPNTDPGAFLGVSMGPTQYAAKLSRTEFVTYINGAPGETKTFELRLADHHEVSDIPAAGGDNIVRSVVVGETNTVEHVTVERWGAHPLVSTAAPGSEIEIDFRASLPEETPDDAIVRVVIEAGSAARTFDLAKAPASHVWHGGVHVPAGARISYRIDASSAERQRLGPDRTLTAEYVGQVVNDWVVSWSANAEDANGTKPGFMTGVYTPDFWSDGMLPLTEPTYQRIADHNGGWVPLSSVWHYGQMNPYPTVESRTLYSPGVLTPRPRVIEQARIAKDLGLKTFLAPQFNFEMVPGFPEQLNEGHSDEWWDAWLEAAEKLWFHHADLAEEIDADLLVLPGPVYHVFYGPDWFESRASFDAFNAKLAELVGRVRQVYSGKLLMSGGVLESEVPGLVDYIGVTTYDTGHPDLPVTATADEWYATYDVLFETALDPKYERWGVPVLLYTINVEAPLGGEGDEFEQAAQLEGIMRAVRDRPWIVGSYMWAYHMINQPIAENGLRARLGEAVMARYYGEFAGLD